MEEYDLATIRNNSEISQRYLFYLERMNVMEDWFNSLTPSISEDALIVKYCLLARSVRDWLHAIRFQVRRCLYFFRCVRRYIDSDFDMDREHTVDVMISLMSQKNHIKDRLTALEHDIEVEMRRFNQLERDVQEYYHW